MTTRVAAQCAEIKSKTLNWRRGGGSGPWCQQLPLIQLKIQSMAHGPGIPIQSLKSILSFCLRRHQCSALINNHAKFHLFLAIFVGHIDPPPSPQKLKKLNIFFNRGEEITYYLESLWSIILLSFFNHSEEIANIRFNLNYLKGMTCIRICNYRW